MPPQNNDTSPPLVEELLAADEGSKTSVMKEGKPLVFKPKVVWFNVVWLTTLHLASIYALVCLTWKCHWCTLIWALVYYIWGALGVTAGSHRLWAHKTYQARFPLRLFLACGQTSAYQNDIYEWARDHRVHHKFSETDADPHNTNRGFFFSHVGWLLVKKHPDVKTKGAGVDVSDLLKDPIVYLQRKPAVRRWDGGLHQSWYFIALNMCKKSAFLSVQGTLCTILP